MSIRRLRVLVPLLLLLAGSAWGLTVPPFTGLLVDQANLLSPDDKARVSARLASFQEATTGQMAVLIVPSLQGDAIEEFGIRVGDAWKVGDKARDDGLILIVAVEDRSMRVEVGYGLEGVVNDARAGDVVRAMAPFFREQRYADGILDAIGRLEAYVRPGAGPAPEPVPPEEEKEMPLFGKILFFLFFGGFIVLFALLARFGKIRPGSGRGSGSSGSFGGGGGGGGGFSGGGGGSFGGGGASGKW